MRTGIAEFRGLILSRNISRKNVFVSEEGGIFHLEIVVDNQMIFCEITARDRSAALMWVGIFF
jgi:hypothetical protein